jgi:5-(carboxyamino)imidazole ribonucleotide mutase
LLERLGILKAPVAIVMGSQSDWATMKHAAEILDVLGVAHESRIVSAHRTPKRLYDFAGVRRPKERVIIAGAGGRPICRGWWRH